MVAQYQTVVNHAKEQIVGFEALCRPWWISSISTELFFESAIQSGNSYEVDMAAMKRAMDMFWYKPVNQTVLFFNALPTTIVHSRFLKDFEQLLVSSGAQANRLVLEITETVPYDTLKLIDTLQSLRSMGIRIALDDVGRGSASLSAIAYVEPEFIKIDRSLVDGIARSGKRERVVSALVDFVGDGAGIIAEGIESQEDLFTVMGLGIPLSQGFLWSQAAHLSDMDFVRLELEMKRFNMYKLGTIHGCSICDPQMIEKSHQIDELVNQVLKRSRP